MTTSQVPSWQAKLSPTSLYWWQRDLTTEIDAFGPPTAGGHEDCLHRKYWMTCLEYEQILRRSGDRCEQCGLPGECNIRGRLYIDHDHAWGCWAVRGLLCTKCNTNLEKPWLVGNFAEYLGRSWYLTAPISLDRIAEPSLTARVTDGLGNTWLRRDAGWYLPFPRTRQPQVDHSWAWLYGEFGPRFLIVDDTPIRPGDLTELHLDVLAGAHEGQVYRHGNREVVRYRAGRAYHAKVKTVADELLRLGLIEAAGATTTSGWRGWERPIRPTPRGLALLATVHA